MPSLILDGKGVEFFYRDSGRPQGDLYTTVLILHGLTFHSGELRRHICNFFLPRSSCWSLGVFQRILPLASSKKLRLICLNRRDYAGTTLYSPGELEVLSSGSKTDRAAFLAARGLEIALVLDRLIDELSLPPPTADSKDGGLALMGWSSGNVEALAAIAGFPSFPPNVQRRLQLYLRRYIMHGESIDVR